ncbi:hypothetical protein Tco_0841594 [Tanacetum coccineum]|uniref:Reverse transcriptase domain-containing protein n=1 Tax=Tanacetum coccineum TaxID=301880 RepID=A0ABQ5AZK4_9ASTR
MLPKKRTTTITTTTPITNAAIKALIAQGVADALAEIKENITSRNGDDNHNSGTGSRRTQRAAHECTYSDFLKCQPLNFNVYYLHSSWQCYNMVEFPRKTAGHDVAYRMPWKTLKKMMTAKYYLRGVKKLEIELWNLKVKESDEVEKYVGGLPDMIQGSVMASEPKTMQDAIDFATKLMDQKIHSLADRQAENKRKFDDTSRNN